MSISFLLAGDVGGTKTHIGLFQARTTAPPELVDGAEFVTLDHPDLRSIIRGFLAEKGGTRQSIAAACFGVAGPVLDNTAQLVNVPWTIDGRALAGEFNWPRVALVNDLAALAHAVPTLEESELAPLQVGTKVPGGNAALIAAGTGLGEALLHNIGGLVVPAASEGGHADFAPRTRREFELAAHLTARFGRVDCERVISGRGLVNLYEFTHPAPCPTVEGDAAELPARLTNAAMAGRCAQCAEALDLFLNAYGAEAGNLALRSVATAGVYVGGGIAPKILPALRAGSFISAFRDKAPFEPLLSRIPVSVILHRHAAMQGAAIVAATLVP
jgi:glucokinase